MSTNLNAAAEAIQSKPSAISVTSLARCCDVTDAHMSRILNPKHANMPSIKLALKMSKCLEVSLDDLMEFLDSLEKPEWAAN